MAATSENLAQVKNLILYRKINKIKEKNQFLNRKIKNRLGNSNLTKEMKIGRKN